MNTASVNDQDFGCTFYPGSSDCQKCILGKKENKKCPNEFTEIDKILDLIKNSMDNQKICEGRKVRKIFVHNE